jgi:estrogen-related receptor beta like 1
MDDDEDTGGPSGGKGGGDAVPLGPAMGPLYQMWENALEKLKILNYESKFCANKGKKPFNRVHFVVPGQNASNQFDDFVDLCAWLFLEVTKSTEAFKREQFDDPTTVVNKLILGLRQLDFRSSFPSQKLKTPYGEPVCTVLDFLTDKTLESKGFKWATPVYLDAAEVRELNYVLQQ